MKIEKVNLSFRGKLTPIKKVTKIVNHHPAHPTWNIVDIHNFHKNSNGWSGIGYNYFITKDGRIQEGRGKNVGAHCKGFNEHTLGICYQGHFDQQEMTDEQVKAGGWLTAKLITEHGLQINDVVNHRDLAATSCPGRNFRMNDLRTEILGHINPNAKKEVVKVANNKPSAWAEKDWNEAVENGYFDGSRPLDNITRQEAAIVINRLRHNFLKLIEENKKSIEELRK